MRQELPKKNEKFPTVTFATKDDIDDILRIQETLLIANRSGDTSLSETGFLVNRASREDLEKAIENQGQAFLIVVRNELGKTVGYCLAYDMKYFLAQNPDWLSDTGLDQNLIAQQRIIYGKHVASDRSMPFTGRSLIESLLKFAELQGYTMFLGEICEAPVSNTRSIEKHAGDEIGLQRIGEYTGRNDFHWGVYAKKLGGVSASTADPLD